MRGHDHLATSSRTVLIPHGTHPHLWQVIGKEICHVYFLECVCIRVIIALIISRMCFMENWSLRVKMICRYINVFLDDCFHF